jgi:hypothetical protein
MNQIDKIIYIDFNICADQKKRIEDNLNGLGLSFERFEAVQTPEFEILGRNLSHIEVIKLAKKRNYKNVLVLEDNAVSVLDRKSMDLYLNDIFNENINYNVIFLSYLLQEYYNVFENLIRIKKNNSTTAYIVHNNYYDELIKVWTESTNQLKLTKEHLLYAHNVSWFPLQKKDLWYAIKPIYFIPNTNYYNYSSNFQNNTFDYLKLTKKNYLKRIFVYGDSHAIYSFNHPDLNVVNRHEASRTMHRVGRDNQIPKFYINEHDENSVLLFTFGEVDCRCHIKKQLNLNRDLKEVLEKLVKNYLNAVKNAIGKYSQIIIVGIIPVVRKSDYELNHKISDKFPFMGTDEERVSYKILLNKLLEEECQNYPDFKYIYPYKLYENENGTLNYDFSDQFLHISKNTHCVEELKLLIFGNIEDNMEL